MGRLAGFRHRDVIQRLRAFGFVFHRHGRGSHEMWVNDATGRSFTISSHARDISEGTLRSILKQAGVTEDDFLA